MHVMRASLYMSEDRKDQLVEEYCKWYNRHNRVRNLDICEIERWVRMWNPHNLNETQIREIASLVFRKWAFISLR